MPAFYFFDKKKKKKKKNEAVHTWFVFCKSHLRLIERSVLPKYKEERRTQILMSFLLPKICIFPNYHIILEYGLANCLFALVLSMNY